MSLVLVSRPIVKKFGKIRAYFWLEIILLTKYFSLKSSKKNRTSTRFALNFASVRKNHLENILRRNRWENDSFNL